MPDKMPTAEHQPRYTFDRVVRMILGTITIVAVVFLLRYLSDVLIPFVVAIILAYLLNPMVTIFESRTKRRWLAVLMTISGLLIIASAILVLLIPLTYWQFQRFTKDLGKLRNDIVASWQTDTSSAEHAQALTHSEPASPHPTGTPLPDNEADLGSHPAAENLLPSKSIVGWHELSEGWAKYSHDADATPPVPRLQRLRNLRLAVSGTYIGDLFDNAAEYVKSDEFGKWLAKTAAQAANIGVGAGVTVIGFGVSIVLALSVAVIVLVYLLFLLLDFPEYAKTWKTLLPPGARDSIVEFLSEFDTAMRRYFRGQSVVAVITAALYAIGFTIIGLPLGVPLAIIIGFLSMVPYLAAIAIVPALMLAVVRSVEMDASLMGSFGLVVLIVVVVQLTQDWVITPRVMGKATGLKPVSILLGVFIWGKLLGFLGILLAIPLTCLFIAYYRRYVLKIRSEPVLPPAG